jgi:hypothetical protein
MTQRQRTARVESIERNGVAVEMILTILSPATENGNHVTVRMGVLEARSIAEQLDATALRMINFTQTPRGAK